MKDVCPGPICRGRKPTSGGKTGQNCQRYPSATLSGRLPGTYKWRANECTSSIRTICGSASKASRRASARHTMDAVRYRSDNSVSPPSFIDSIAAVPLVSESPAQTFPSSSPLLHPSGEIACQVNSRWTVRIRPHLAPFGPVQCIRTSGKRILGNARYAV